MNQTLNGKHILVTRPAQQAENLCRLIAEQGGIPVRFPTIAIKAVPQNPSATFPAEQLSKYQWLIFISSNAVNFALDAIGGKIRQFCGAKIAAIGKATANALTAAGIHVDAIPQAGNDSEALLVLPELTNVTGQRILIVRGQGGREVLADELVGRGALVDYWEVYQRTLPTDDNGNVIKLLIENKLAVITITSGEALQNLLVLIGENYKKQLLVVPLVVISERIGKLATDIGFNRVAITNKPSDEAILEQVTTVIDGDNSG